MKAKLQAGTERLQQEQPASMPGDVAMSTILPNVACAPVTEAPFCVPVSQISKVQEQE